MKPFVHPQPVGIIGGGTCSPSQYDTAYKVAFGLAENRLAVLCGGRGGVMEAACKGAFDAGGSAIALLPGVDLASANPFVTLALPTGLGNRDQAIADGRPDFSRNRIIAMAASCLVAIGGASGTANEIKLGLLFGKTVYCLENAPPPEDADQIDPRRLENNLIPMNGSDETVEAVLELVGTFKVD